LAVGAKGEQVFVAGDDEVGPGTLGTFEDLVVVGIAAEVDGAVEGDANRMPMNSQKLMLDA